MHNLSSIFSFKTVDMIPRNPLSDLISAFQNTGPVFKLRSVRAFLNQEQIKELRKKDESDFLDYRHFSEEGAVKFSRRLSVEINKITDQFAATSQLSPALHVVR